MNQAALQLLKRQLNERNGVFGDEEMEDKQVRV